MTISVIIPVYKVEKYIRRCLESIIDQENDRFMIECLIVDDCSPDNSMAIVEEVMDNYRGSAICFKIIKHEVNKGLSAARNSGIMASTGEYLYFIDSDDHILENTFKCYYSYFLEHPSVDVIMGNSLETEFGRLTNSSETNDNNTICLINDKRTLIHNVLRRQVDRHAWNKLIRRSIIIENDLFFDDGLLYEDVTWTYRLSFVVSSILIVPELTYMYEYNPSSIIHTHAERAKKIVWSFVYISNYIFNNPPVIDGKKVFFSEHCLFVNHWMLYAIDNYEKYGAEKLTRSILNSLKRKLLWISICHLRPVMALYFLTMFRPFCWLLKVKAYRAHIDRIIQIVYKLS